MSTQEAAALVYVTAPSLAEAEALAGTLVEEHLAACVNIVPGVRSVYRWQGAVQRDDEVLMLVKTTVARADAVCQRLAQLHSYELPCAVVYPAHGGLPAALGWIAEQTRA